MTDARITLDAAALDLLHDENAHDLLGNYPEVISQARAALALRDELAAAKKQESAQTTAAQRAWLAADTLRNELAECQQKHAACDDCLDNTKAELAECRALVQLHMDDSAVNAREADDLRAKLAQAEQERDEARNANLSVRVCRNHTSEVIGEGCLVCDLAASLAAHDAEVGLRVVSECAMTMRSRCSCSHCDENEPGWKGREIVERALAAQAATHSVPDGTSEVAK